MPTLKTFHGLPDAAVFDASGNYIEYRMTDTSCNAGLFDFIPKLNPANTYKKPGTLTLAKELKKLKSLSGTPLPVAFAKKADFYVLIYWATYIGKLNKDHVTVWEEEALHNKNYKVRVIKVNADWQAWWNSSTRDSIIRVMKK